MDRHISMIIAQDCMGGIGMEGKLPWPTIKEDFQWFKKHTEGQIVVMGRKTWDSLPIKPLPNRTNVVLTTRVESLGNEVEGYTTIEAVMDDYRDRDIVIIGGAQLLSYCAKYITRCFITDIHAAYPTDLRMEGNWEEWDMVFFDSYTSPRCDFKIFERNDGDELVIHTSRGAVSERKERRSDLVA